MQFIVFYQYWEILEVNIINSGIQRGQKTSAVWSVILRIKWGYVYIFNSCFKQLRGSV